MAKAHGQSRMIVEIRAQAEDVIDLLIYDVIGEDWDGTGVTAKKVATALAEKPNAKTINVAINSAGGQVFDALSIYNRLVQHKAHVAVSIDGAALSAASLIAMAGDEIAIAENAMMMIHEAQGIAVGPASEMRKMADELDKANATLTTTYAARTGHSAEEVGELMAAETFFTAEEAVELGFATRVVEAKRIAAHVDLSRYHNAPEWVGQLVNSDGDQIMPATKCKPRAQEEEEEKKEAQEEEETEAQEEEESKPVKDQEPDEDDKKKAQDEEEEEEDSENKPATAEQIESAVPHASADYVLACLKAGLTAQQAVAMSKVTAVQKRAPGGPGLPEGQRGTPKASGDFLADAKAYAAQHQCSKTEAMRVLARDNPEAHEAWVASQAPAKK